MYLSLTSYLNWTISLPQTQLWLPLFMKFPSYEISYIFPSLLWAFPNPFNPL